MSIPVRETSLQRRFTWILLRLFNPLGFYYLLSTPGMVTMSSFRSTKQQPPQELVREHTPMYMPINMDYPGLRVVHQKPPIFFIDNFLTDEECDQLILVAGPMLQRSKTHAIAGMHPLHYFVTSDFTTAHQLTFFSCSLP